MEPTPVRKNFARLSPAELESLAAELTWFHAIDCGAFQTSGRFKPGDPQNSTLYGVFDLIGRMDLRGQSCLDIGAADGLLGFGMKTLGAEKVTATDTYRMKSFDLARAALGIDIDYFPKLQIKDLLAAFQPASFDLVACAGIIYHMLNPFSALLTCRQLVKEGGYFIVETAYAPEEKSASMVFNPAAEINPEQFTYWLPSRTALEGMMRTACFEVVATRTIQRLPRIAMLGRAVKPAEVGKRTPLMKKIHEVDFCDHEFRLAALFENPRPASTITMQPVPADADINRHKWTGSFPHHPKSMPNPKGSTRWASAEGNF